MKTVSIGPWSDRYAGRRSVDALDQGTVSRNRRQINVVKSGSDDQGERAREVTQ